MQVLHLNVKTLSCRGRLFRCTDLGKGFSTDTITTMKAAAVQGIHRRYTNMHTGLFKLLGRGEDLLVQTNL